MCVSVLRELDRETSYLREPKKGHRPSQWSLRVTISDHGHPLPTLSCSRTLRKCAYKRSSPTRHVSRLRHCIRSNPEQGRVDPVPSPFQTTVLQRRLTAGSDPPISQQELKPLWVPYPACVIIEHYLRVCTSYMGERCDTVSLSTACLIVQIGLRSTKVPPTSTGNRM